MSTNERLADGRIFVLVLDGLHVSPASIVAVQRSARQFVEENVGPADLAAVLSPGAVEAATQDFTSDKARLVAAIDRFSGTKLRSATLELEEERQVAGTEPACRCTAAGTRATPSAPIAPSPAPRCSRPSPATWPAVQRRRKALMLFSEGVDYNLVDVMGVVQQHGSSVQQATERAVQALMRADVSLYAIDPRGLDSAASTTERLPSYDSPNAPRADGSIPRLDFSEPSLEKEYGRRSTSLRHVAESTGGFAAVDRNDVERGVRAHRPRDERLLRHRVRARQAREAGEVPADPRPRPPARAARRRAQRLRRPRRAAARRRRAPARRARHGVAVSRSRRPGSV